MKNIIIIILLLLMTGCGVKQEVKNQDIIQKDDKVIENKYVDSNPVTVGLYLNDITLVHDYHTKRENNKDIVFNIYYSNDEQLENNNQKYNWAKYYNSYSNIENNKIGFQFSFYSGEEKIDKTIIGPETFVFEPCFFVYLYDDIHQPDGTFYSHVEKDQVTDDTIFSSIKIYLVESAKITSPIELTVFTYDGLDDFDSNNNYRGNSKYTITINLE